MNMAMILAGGVGSRVGADIPKQFIEVQGKPILIHTLEKFQACNLVDEIEVVCIASYIDKLQDMVREYHLSKVTHIVEGGATYQDSVIQGLSALEDVCTEEDVVSIHFGAGPFVTEEIITDSIRVAQEYGNGISSDPVVLCLAEKDASDGNRSSVIGCDRDRVMGLNSPQSFRFGLVRDMYAEGERQGLFEKIDPHTTTLMAALGVRLYFSKGSTANIKITTADDLRLFEGWLLAGDTDSAF